MTGVDVIIPVYKPDNKFKQLLDIETLDYVLLTHSDADHVGSMDVVFDNFDVKKVTEDCVKWIQDWFEENGKGCNAVLGISGGKDSSVAAALCVKALGKDRVFGVLMPQGDQFDIQYSYDLDMQIYTENVDGDILHSNLEQILGELMQKYIGIDMSSLTTLQKMSPASSMSSLGSTLWQELLPGKQIQENSKERLFLFL